MCDAQSGERALGGSDPRGRTFPKNLLDFLIHGDNELWTEILSTFLFEEMEQHLVSTPDPVLPTLHYWTAIPPEIPKN